MRVILHTLGYLNHLIIVASCSLKGKEQKAHTWDMLFEFEAYRATIQSFFTERGKFLWDCELGVGSLLGRNRTTCDWISLGSRLSSSGHCSVVRTVSYWNWPMCHEYQSRDFEGGKSIIHWMCQDSKSGWGPSAQGKKITVTSEVPERVSLEWAQPKHTTCAQAKPALVGW